MMCTYNPRNCALRDKHDGRCMSAIELNWLVQDGIEQLLYELETIAKGEPQ